MLSHLDIIINPGSGKEEPILSWLAKALDPSPITWKAHVINAVGEAAVLAKALAGKTSAVAAYGGDGTVTEVARGLYQTSTPLAIIPGGTANVMAKELSIPVDTQAAITLLAGNNYRILPIDMALVNDDPFLLRINMGIFADMVTEASTELKDRWGQWAYGITALQTLQKASPVRYELEVDGETFTQEAVAVTIMNAGNIGRQGYSLLPGISVTDGLLDVVMLDNADVLTLLKATTSTALQTESAVLRHWQGKDIRLRADITQTYIRDDETEEARQWHVKVVPHSLNVIVPHE